MSSPYQSSNQLPQSQNQNGAHLAAFINPLLSNSSLFPGMFADANSFNQHLINNLASSLFLQSNVWSKFISDLTLSSTLLSQASVSVPQPKSEIKTEIKKPKNSFSINDIINGTINHIHKPEAEPLNLSTSTRNLNSSSIIPKTDNPKSKLIDSKSKIADAKVDLFKKKFCQIEEKLKFPLRFNFKRDTIVRELTNNGVKGDVIYYSPCGKKLRNFQEIDRFLYKYYTEQRQKTGTIQLTKDNFTFSSKYIVGNYLILKETPSNNKYLSSNYPINHNTIKDLKYDVFSEKEIRAKILELYPDFRRTTNELSNTSDVINQSIKSESHHKNNEHLIETLDEKKVNDTFKNYKNYSKQSEENHVLREKKTRQRWFDYIVCQYTDKQIQNEGFVDLNYQNIDFQIEDLKQKYLNKIPDFEVLNAKLEQSNLSWLGDGLQFIEFLKNFSPKITESIGLIDEQYQVDFKLFTSSIKNFYFALKNFKYKKELNEIVQIFLKILLNNTDDDSGEDLNDDESYLLTNICQFDMTEYTFSEILRLYFLKSHKNLTKHRQNYSFNQDITRDMAIKLENFVSELSVNQFEHLKTETKSSILAHLTDDLVQNSPFLKVPVYDMEPRETNLIVDYIDENIEKLNKSKQDKIQLESKLRHSKLSIADKKLEKKKESINEEISNCQKILRSGLNLGQDRFKRSYWKLNNHKDLLIEADYCSLTNKKSDQEQVNDCMEQLLNQIELSDQEKIIKKYRHLIEFRQDPFDLIFKIDEPECLNLSFNDIEILVKNLIEFKTAKNIDREFLSEGTASSKWWLCENAQKTELLNSLSKRGYREKILFKNLNEETNSHETDLFSNFDNPQSISLEKLIRNEKVKILKQIYSLENKVYSANLQLPDKDMREARKMSDDTENSDDEDTDDIVHMAKSRLLNLEKSIDKRYLKYPFSFKKKLSNYKIKVTNEQDGVLLDKIGDDMEMRDINLAIRLNKHIREYMKEIGSSRDETVGEDGISSELLRWRRLVSGSKTTSQLALYLNQLSKLIEWDKSIMKVSCHICSMDDNEEKLLLCDNCDLGYHTYCFKPKIEKIPDGDWYCFKCISKFLNRKQMCFVCGRDNSHYHDNKTSRNNQNNLNKCEKCSIMFHTKCLANAKFFKTTLKWHCLNCQSAKPKPAKLEQEVEIPKEAEVVKPQPKKKGRKRKNQTTEEENNKTKQLSDKKKSKTEYEKIDNMSDEEMEPSMKKFNSFSEKLTMKKLKQQNESDLYKCRMLFQELMRNKYATNFIDRVNEKDYPDYYQVIKEPIDLITIKEKLKNKKYENKEQFAYDCRLIFDNCESFNEDNSQIGQAGHKLRAFFETKWLRLFD